ncbi:restriction endonuclease subunit S [Salmonella enterica subsp. enterica serovar Ajiobo]|nr:restriction endonuclease subunit S [Salmonella enterica subsp. enterica serovar Ajiobo]ECF5808406.1 restriction endonuclease subunit S [Salmonella enterica subsp. enterica serovar Bahati]ECG3766936.1 restriction endonuclease subunit S [Salmonella enterica subsp. enterica serovar Durham]ECH9283678.1 restriction endonuclease subunit S [Salmonella enterica subsp. enterica]EGQ4724461.1 restriction endonuclease subunit S [Salmonella enterica subsp. enterica serovar Telelkebir]EJO1137606.1 restri
MAVEKLIVDHIDTWTTARQTRSTTGRGSSGKIDLYGIKKLRELILELAVRGKLVPQDPNDEPASVLLKRIAAEKAELVKQGKIKKQKPLPEISEEEKPFELPVGWEWVRLGEISDAVTGNAFKTSEYSDEGTFVLRVTNINPDGSINLTDSKFIPHNIAENKYSNFSLVEGDILLVMVGGSLGKIGIVDSECLPALLNQNMWKMVNTRSIRNDFFIFGLKFINANQLNITHSTHGHLAQGDYLSKCFPLAPKDEQTRIINKVNVLMSLCDQLEQHSLTSLDAHQQLVETLLTTLTDSQNADQLAENWSRISEHFDTLFTTEASIDALKQTILQLAVMGKLVPQDSSDEPASELLKRIAQEKAQLVKDGKMKKQKPLPPISDEEKPFELPEGWVYCRMDDLCSAITSGSTPSKEIFSTDDGIPYLKVYNIRNQQIDFKYQPQFIQRQYHFEKMQRSILYPGDVIMNIVGPPLGKIAIIPDYYPEWNCNQAIVLFRLIKKDLNEYIYTYLLSGIFLDFIELIGTAGQDNISIAKSKNIVIPLPPIYEQKKIVEKLSEIMNVISELKHKINITKQTQLHLADALTDAAIN